MNEAVGTQIAADSGSGEGEAGTHDLTLKNNAAFLGPDAGGGVELEPVGGGVGDYLDFGSGFAFAATDGFTFAAWVRHDAFQNSGSVLSLVGGAGGTARLDRIQFYSRADRRGVLSIWNNGTYDNFNVPDGSTDPADIFFAPIGQWAHVAWTVTTSGTFVLYRDGKSRDAWKMSGGVAANPNPGVVYAAAALGRCCPWGDGNVYGSNYLNGALRDVRMYNYALSAEQVRDLHAATAPPV